MTESGGQGKGERGYAHTDFHPGARAYSSDGTHVGSLDRVIVDAETWQLRGIIVKETKRFSGHLFTPGTALITEDVIVPPSRRSPQSAGIGSTSR